MPPRREQIRERQPPYEEGPDLICRLIILDFHTLCLPVVCLPLIPTPGRGGVCRSVGAGVNCLAMCRRNFPSIEKRFRYVSKRVWEMEVFAVVFDRSAST